MIGPWPVSKDLPLLFHCPLSLTFLTTTHYFSDITGIWSYMLDNKFLMARTESSPSWYPYSWGRKWQLTLIFLPGKSHGQRSLEGYSPQGRKRVGHNLATNDKPHSTLWKTGPCEKWPLVNNCPVKLFTGCDKLTPNSFWPHSATQAAWMEETKSSSSPPGCALSPFPESSPFIVKCQVFGNIPQMFMYLRSISARDWKKKIQITKLEKMIERCLMWKMS